MKGIRNGQGERKFLSRLTVLLCAGALTLVTGCSGSNPSAHPTASAAMKESTVYPGAYQLPTEVVSGRDPSFWKTISDREQQLIGQCMAQRGFAYTASNSSQLQQYPPDIYGVVDREWASVYGYMSRTMVDLDAFEATQPKITNDTPVPVMDLNAKPSDYDNALVGVKPEVKVKAPSGHVIAHYHPDGCYWIGTLAVEPDTVHEGTLRTELSNLVKDSEDSVSQSEAYLSAESTWKQCMAGHGYTVSDPFLSSEMENPNSPMSHVTADSIAMAVQDVDCKNSTGFLKTWSRLLVEAETQALEKHPGLIEEINTIQMANYNRAVGDSK